MRLLNSRSKQLELSHPDHPPPYAVVSHRWGDESEEVLFGDIGDLDGAQAKGKGLGHEKILGSCAQALQDGFNYIWLDTCCIDKSNSTEVNEAINSMYKWYKESEVCYAYLHDVIDPSEFTESSWFTRGWTLQELIAPKLLKFFTKDWKLIGTREELIDHIAERTGISHQVLRSNKIPPEVTISQKMLWAAQRQTAKVEDRAYSLLGIFDINVEGPVYGIDDGAFENLQHRIIEKYNDQTLFAWYHTAPQLHDVEMAKVDPASEPALVQGDTSPPSPSTTGLLAFSSSRYLKSYEISEVDFRRNYVNGISDGSYRLHLSTSSNLVHISVPMKHMEGKIWKAVLRCSLEPPDEDEIQRPLVIYLKENQPSLYFRLHLPRNKEGEDDDQTYEVKDIPGSLERLSDAESCLEGYVLRDIHVVGRYGESSPDDQRGQPHGDRRISGDLRACITRDGKFPVAAGGHADIYKGMLSRVHQMAVKVAIKAIKVYSAESAEDNYSKKTKRLRREVKVWMKLNHPNIVPLLGTTSGFGPFPAMVCPWLENGTLSSYLERSGADLEILQILTLIHDIASGLQYLHSQPVVHGDLSGSNVLIDAHGKACIADFGLSTVLDEIGGSTFGTSLTGKPRGTLRWAAPELLGLVDHEDAKTQHSKPTTQCDVYSFGGIMLQVLSGKVPYHYYSRDMQVIAAIFRGETPTRPDNPRVTDPRWEVIQRCWSPFRNVVQRPCSEDIVAFSTDDLARHSSSAG